MTAENPISREDVWLDYADAASADLLKNLSAVTTAGPLIWTASDEGRTVECLEPVSGGYRLRKQLQLDDIFAVPGTQKNDELDIESLDAVDGTLWIGGSHCIVRGQSRKKKMPDHVDPRFRVRKSRRLLGCMTLAKTFDDVSSRPRAETLPFEGPGSIRRLLADHPFIAPFLKLPSKENGLDIEGIAVLRKKLMLGLRGPLVDSVALAVELDVAKGLSPAPETYINHFLDLGGLGIRDLARWKSGLMILAGPVSSAAGPFRLYRWNPRTRSAIQRPNCVHEWPPGEEKPEGMCRLDRNGKRGMLVLYDSPAGERIEKTRYRADWLTGF